MRHTDSRSGVRFNALKPTIHYNQDQHLQLLLRLKDGNHIRSTTRIKKIKELENEVKYKSILDPNHTTNVLLKTLYLELTKNQKIAIEIQNSIDMLYKKDEQYYIDHPQHTHKGQLPLSQQTKETLPTCVTGSAKITKQGKHVIRVFQLKDRLDRLNKSRST